jgi:hypothetical protein
MTIDMTQDEFNAARGKHKKQAPLGKRRKKVELPDIMVNSPGVVTFALPLPHRVLHPNGRTRKHGWRAKLVKEARQLAGYIARCNAPAKPWKRAKYRVTFSLPRKQDEDNLGAWLKSYLDGIQDAGIVANDSGLTRDSLVILSGKKQTGGKVGVRFEIWEQPSP